MHKLDSCDREWYYKENWMRFKTAESPESAPVWQAGLHAYTRLTKSW